jgi:hypothetical protein
MSALRGRQDPGCGVQARCYQIRREDDNDADKDQYVTQLRLIDMDSSVFQ